MRRALLLLACWSCWNGLVAASEIRGLDVPIVGQPAHFAGAVGDGFTVESRLSARRVEAEQPLTLTVSIAPRGAWLQAPRRPRIDLAPRVAERFHVDPTRSDQPDRVRLDPLAWEFDYRLRPRGTEVRRLPPLAFAWFRPSSDPAFRGWFPTTYASEVPLEVAAPDPDLRPPDAPARFREIVVGPDLLAGTEPFRPPGWPVVGLLLLGPPLAAGLWVAASRRLVAGPRARQQSLAARRALSELAKPLDADGVAQAAAAYFRARFEGISAEPTVDELKARLERHGTSAELLEEALAFLRRCDQARFAPAESGAEPGLREAAARLIGRLEAEA